MKRPPSRSSSSKRQSKARPSKDNVVQLFDRKPRPKVAKGKPKSETKGSPKRSSKRTAVVTKLRPRTSFGRRVFLATMASIAALVVLVLVAVFSPLLAVSKIEIVGAKMVEEKTILKDLKSLLGKPLPQVSSDDVALRLSKYDLIDSVSVVSVPPNTLRVLITERSAIAIVVINNISYLYDAAGVQLGRASEGDRLPVIAGAGNPASSKAFSRSIDVILSLPLSLLPEVSWIRAISKDNVVLGLRKNGQSILWGDSSAPGLKAEVLLALMKHYKRTLNLTFDVSSPSQPSVY